MKKDLRNADLYYADLYGADLRDANLRGANLSNADLYGADLYGANLRDANLRDADLRDANLSYANLRGANLSGANLSRTVLDPNNTPNANVDGFEIWRGRVIGYRTVNQPHLHGPSYRPGRMYHAPWFSTCVTACHPGLYLQPAPPEGRHLVVTARPEDVHRAGNHRAGNKWRCRKFYALRIVEEES